MDKKILTQVVREVRRSLDNWDIKKLYQIQKMKLKQELI